MPAYSKIKVKDNDLLSALQLFFRRLLESDQMDALLVPWHLPDTGQVMPTLIHDPESTDSADPLAPCFPLNAAKMASRLTKRESGRKLGLVMRPCEIRAFVELVKLKQGSLDNVTLIGMDCLGAYSNSDFAEISAGNPEDSTQRFYEEILETSGQKAQDPELAPACRVCEHPVPETADISLELYGVDYRSQVPVKAETQKGEVLLNALELEPVSEPAGRSQAVEALVKSRITARDGMFERVEQETAGIEKLSRYFSRCVNCYNCRVACPVCYCKECVFVTDVFDHDPFQYFQWASRRGKVKMPSDTDFFHLTRMAHIGLTCVGCGQCSNACPNDIPVMDLFRTIAHKAQKAFEYEAGRQVDEPIPLSVFENEEYEEVVGIESQSM